MALLGFPLLRTADFFSKETLADSSFAGGSMLLQVVYGSAFAAAAFLLWRNGRQVQRLLPRLNPFLLLMVGWCACTLLWSPYPTVTLKRVVQLVGLVLCGLAICLPATFRLDFRKAAMTVLTTLLALSLLVVLVLPQVGVDESRGYAWRGIFWHKNLLGAASGICLLLWLDAWLERLVSRRAAMTGLAFVLLMLVMSRSSTAVLTALGGCAVYALLRRRELAESNTLPIAALAGVVVALAGAHLFYVFNGRLPGLSELTAPVALLVGKDPDLTGRTELWQYVLVEVARHPLRGLGYGAFWLNVGSPSQYIIDAVNWIPLQAHNGYIDILNELGAIGFAIFVLLLGSHAYLLLALGRYDRSEAALHWALLAIVVVSNFAESTLFNGVLFLNAIFILSSVLVPVSIHRHQQGAIAVSGGRP